MLVDLLVAFNLGLASQLHCVGMCGGVVAALAVAVPPAVRARRGRLLAIALGYNGGRVASYSLAGAVAGLLGSGVVAGSTAGLHGALRVLAGLVLVGSGLHLGGWLRWPAALEALGLRTWRHVQPWGRRLLPVDGPLRACAFGMLWGFMPCALVYSTLLFAATRADPLAGAAILAVFGLGTLPALVTSAWLANRAPAWCTRPAVRYGAAALLIAAGLAYPLLGAHDHATHDHATHDHATHDHAPR